jgi:hypothetical protein
MNIIKKFYYVIKGKYHKCTLCDGYGKLKVNEYSPGNFYENFYADRYGFVWLKCPSCDKSGIVWG